MATVIKASGPIRIADGMSFNFQDMAALADQYLDQVRAKATTIIEEAEQSAEVVRRRAEHQGKQAAIAAVERVMEEKVGRQIASLLPALRQAVEGIQSSRAELFATWEKSAVHVACQIAGRVLRKETELRPDITLTLVREALEMAAGSPEIVLRLHPSDKATLGRHVEQLTAEMARLGNVEVVADEKISPGGCRVDTRQGVIDQQFEAQLQRIEDELT